jgi:hypothetical protein
MSEKNIDSLLMQSTTPVTVAEPEKKVEPVEQKPVEHKEAAEAEPAAGAYGESEKDKEEREEIDSRAEESYERDESTESDESSESNVDDYGNKAEKSKMYSEEEVQRMIRDRLSRGQNAQQPTQQQVQQAADDFIPDSDSSDSWEVQLEGFIEKTLKKAKTKEQQLAWQQQEQETQAQFESKFNAGMSKYKDFQKTVAGKPITDAMMMSARTLKDPAAFIYAACKLQPKEIDRISKLNDPYQQAAEIGRLEEKMRKARNSVSSAAKPLQNPKGDMPSKGREGRSIDDLIRLHAKQKAGR